MFGPTPFHRDPFHLLSIPSSLSYKNYMVPHLSPHLYEPLYHRHRIPKSPRPRHHQSEYQPRRRRSLLSGSEFSDEDTTNDAYYLDDENVLNDPLPRQREYYSDNQDIASSFRKVSVKLPGTTMESFGRDELLILPPTLAKLKIQVRTPTSSSTIHAAVAGDMLFRDVIKHLLPSGHSGGVRVFVKLRDTWQEPGLVRLSELAEQGRFLLNERREMDVKLEIGGRGIGAGRTMERRGMKAWERETGRGWEIRG